MDDDELFAVGPLSEEALEALSEREHAIREKGYIAGAAAAWRSIARQAVREVRSYGAEVEDGG